MQVSDIHLSRYAAQQLPQFGDKEGDWGHFALAVLRPLNPGALVLTGDLVDGKTRLLRGAQDEGEWKVRPWRCYKLLNHLAAGCLMKAFKVY